LQTRACSTGSAYQRASSRQPAGSFDAAFSRTRIGDAADIIEYDLDSNAIDRQDRSLFLERFIHGETYKVRPDVFAVIHSHSPTVIPFSIRQTPLQPVFNGAAFSVSIRSGI
jgi:Ribulose-5-phosphate 4-epimerase and related epimerases and aldolases